MPSPFTKKSPSPIGIDFGTTALKALQLAPASRTEVTAAAALATPPELQSHPDARLRWQMDQLPALVRSAKFSGKRAVCAVGADRTIVENFAIAKAGGICPNEALALKVAEATGREASTLIIRSEEVGEAVRSGTKCAETLCIAMPRNIVTEHMKAMRSAKLDPVGIHCEHAALARAFDAVCAEDTQTATLFVDLGASAARAAVATAGRLIASRTILAPLAAPPQLLGATGSGTPATHAPQVNTEAANTVAEELGQLARYCGAVFAQTPIKQAVFTGGLSADIALCTQLAKTLRLPARVGDALTGCAWPSRTTGDTPQAADPKQAWTVALGLCLSPTDL